MWSTRWAEQEKIVLVIRSHRKSIKIGAQRCAKRLKNKDFGGLVRISSPRRPLPDFLVVLIET